VAALQRARRRQAAAALTLPDSGYAPRGRPGRSLGAILVLLRRPHRRTAAKATRTLAGVLDAPVRGRFEKVPLWLPGALLALALLAVSEIHLDGADASLLRGAIFLSLGIGLGALAGRLRIRIDVLRALRQGQDALGEGLAVTDPRTRRIVHASPAAATIYGRPLDEVIGLDSRELAAPEELAQIEARVALRAAGHRVPPKVQLKLRKPGGELGYVELSTAPVCLDGEELLFSIVRDITAQRRTEARLAEEHAFMDAVLDAAAGPLAVLGPDGAVLRANAAALRLTGLPRTHVLGRTPWALGVITPALAAEAGAALAAGHDPFRRRLVARDADGVERVTAWTAGAIRDADGAVRCVVAVGTDETEQARAEQRALGAQAAMDLHSRELDRANRDLTQLAALAAHDLREPARAIGAFADLMAARAGGALDARSRGYLDAIRQAGAQMDELLDGLVAYGSLPRGEAPADDVDCQRTLDAVMTDLAAEIEARGATVTHDPLPVVPGDAGELSALLEHLLANALRHGRADGPQVHVSAQRRGLGWQLTVADDGAAVPERERERIFQIFRGGRHERAAGGGMGLAVCQRIVERHRGAIWVEDADGGGSAICVTLPDREAR